MVALCDFLVEIFMQPSAVISYRTGTHPCPNSTDARLGWGDPLCYRCRSSPHIDRSPGAAHSALLAIAINTSIQQCLEPGVVGLHIPPDHQPR